MAQKCRFEYFSSTFHLRLCFKNLETVNVGGGFSQTDSVSNGKNVSPPKISADSVSGCKILSKTENFSNPENLKTIFKISQITWLCRTAKNSQAARN
jgi:hypothetical protein